MEYIDYLVNGAAQVVYESCDDLTKEEVDALVDEGMILSEALAEVGLSI